MVIYCILRSISKSFLTSTKFILLFSIKVSRFLATISRFLVLLPKDGYAIQIFPIILNMGCVVLYICREYEKNGQSFFVPFSIKVPRFMPTISRFLFFTRECELWCFAVCQSIVLTIISTKVIQNYNVTGVFFFSFPKKKKKPPKRALWKKTAKKKKVVDWKL